MDLFFKLLITFDSIRHKQNEDTTTLASRHIVLLHYPIVSSKLWLFPQDSDWLLMHLSWDLNRFFLFQRIAQSLKLYIMEWLQWELKLLSLDEWWKKWECLFRGSDWKRSPTAPGKNVVNGHQMSQSIPKKVTNLTDHGKNTSVNTLIFIPVADLQTSRLNFYCSSMMSAIMNLKDKNLFHFPIYSFLMFLFCLFLL